MNFKDRLAPEAEVSRLVSEAQACKDAANLPPKHVPFDFDAVSNVRGAMREPHRHTVAQLEHFAWLMKVAKESVQRASARCSASTAS